MQSNSKRLILALAIIVPAIAIGAVLLAGQDRAPTADTVLTPSSDSGVVLAAPPAPSVDSDSSALSSAVANAGSDENPLKPLGPKASDRLPSACGRCSGR